MLILPGTIATYFVGSSIAIVASVARFVSNTFNPGGSNDRHTGCSIWSWSSPLPSSIHW